MKVLIGCEESGIERDAFISLGHDAISCDLLPSRRPGPHYQGDIMDLKGEYFDLAIFHPVCRYLSNSGVRWLHSDPKRWPKMFKATEFFNQLKEFNVPKYCIENPVMHGYAKKLVGQQTQLIQPYMFGHTEKKATCLWLHNIHGLEETNNIYDEMMKLPYKERCRVHYMAPGPERERLRGEAFTGIAAAMALQWGGR